MEIKSGRREQLPRRLRISHLIDIDIINFYCSSRKVFDHIENSHPQHQLSTESHLCVIMNVRTFDLLTLMYHFITDIEGKRKLNLEHETL